MCFLLATSSRNLGVLYGQALCDILQSLPRSDLSSCTVAEDPDVDSVEGVLVRPEGMYDKANIVLFDRVKDLTDEQLLDS